jgi:hypothetical protein
VPGAVDSPEDASLLKNPTPRFDETAAKHHVDGLPQGVKTG